MKRTARQTMARQTVEILDRGTYTPPGGPAVSLADDLAACLDGTRHLTPRDLDRIKYEVLATPPTWAETTVEVRNETTLAGARREVAAGGPVVVLNFASAKNPGGGFLNGSEAQEESLARSSGLYASLLRAPEYYASHRRDPSYLYSDAMIVSPGCPVFRGDAGDLLVDPYRVTFVTAAAPNAGAAAANRPGELPLVPDALRRRADFVLAAAAGQRAASVILGAWGCGVFRNDPDVVARTFADLLAPGGPWRGRFGRVVFSVFDPTPARANYVCFRDTLTGS